MKKFKVYISAALAAGAVAAFAVLPSADANAPGTGLILCHDPSGQNPITLTTPNQNSYDAHIGHGDTPGPCPTEEPPPTTTTEEPPPTTTTPEEPPTETTPPIQEKPRPGIPPKPGVTPAPQADETPAPGPADTPQAQKAAKRAAQVANNGGAAAYKAPGQYGG